MKLVGCFFKFSITTININDNSLWSEHVVADRRYLFTHLHVHQGLADGAAVVLLVPPGGVTNHADRLLVLRAEELEPLPVERTHLPRLSARLLRPQLRAVALLQVGLAEVLQDQAGDRLVQGLAPAQRAVPAPADAPVLLQAGRAEAVAALEDDRVSEDLAADGAGQVGLREPTCHPDDTFWNKQRNTCSEFLSPPQSDINIRKNVLNSFKR